MVVQNSIKHRYLWLLAPLLRWPTLLPLSMAYLCGTLHACSCISVVLKFCTIPETLQKYHWVQDDTTEAAILLKKKQRADENQDYEVELATLAERNRTQGKFTTMWGTC